MMAEGADAFEREVARLERQQDNDVVEMRRLQDELSEAKQRIAQLERLLEDAGYVQCEPWELGATPI